MMNIKQKSVVRCCLEHAASVAKTFLMSDCVVVEIKEPKPVFAGNLMDRGGHFTRNPKWHPNPIRKTRTEIRTEPKCFLSSFKLIKRASESISLRPSIFCFQAKVLHLQQATLPHVSVDATHSQREHNHQRRHIIIISVHSPPHNQHHLNLKLIPLQIHYHLEIEGAYRRIKEIINIINTVERVGSLFFRRRNIR
ncbi:hypothetical protein YC2023_122314 [Brassica napus]